MFGFIKKLFGGIFAFLGGLLGGKKAKADSESTPKIAPKAKKSNGYYLELDETGNTKSEASAKKLEPVKAAVAAVEAVVPAPAQAAVAAVATAVAPEKVEAAAPAKKAKSARAAKAKAPAAESENGKVKVEAQPNPPAETNGKASDPTFAPNYLMPTASSSRRRPGPSMNVFRDMARQVKTPG